MQKIKNCQNILEEHQGDDKQDSELLVQRQTNTPMEKNTKPRNRPTGTQTLNLQQRWHTAE